MNELQKQYTKTMAEIKANYPEVISAIIDNIANGDSIDRAVDSAYRDTYYLQRVEGQTVAGVMGTSQLGLGTQLTLDLGLAKDYYLFTEFHKGITLSGTVWSGENQKAVKKAIGDYLQKKGNVKGLSKEIKKAGANNAKLPKSISKLMKDIENVTPNDIQKANRYIKTLETPALRKSYQRLVKAIGDNKNITTAVNSAIRGKSNYLNDRTARTEMARAYGQSAYRQAHEDKDIVAVKVSLSSSHRIIDVCNFIVEQDPAGWGISVYPLSMLPSFPFHQMCLCMIMFIRRNPDNPLKNGRYSKQRSFDYLDSLSEQKRVDILGLAVSKDRKRWLPTMEKKGFKMLSNQPKTAKKVIKEL